jgi:integrase
MGALKVVLKKDKKKDGTYPLAFRITKDRTTHYILIGHSILQKDWDETNQKVKKSHPNSARLNNIISSKYAEAYDKLLEMETKKNDVSSVNIKKGLVSAKAGTFFKQAEIYLDNLKKNGKFNQHTADSPRVERLREFLNGADIVFEEINPSLLKRFKAFLKGTRGITERTAVNHLVVIRTIFNQAIAAGVADKKHYPFGKGKIVIKFPDSIKIGLTPEEVKKLEDLDLPNGPYNNARNIWLFSFYFAGMRISDVLRLKWSDFQDNRLYYAMGKNAKGDSLMVTDKALKILAQYKRPEPKHNLVFPDLESLDSLDDPFEVQRRINQRVKRIDTLLKKIGEQIETDKKLTMHIARHTFGNISGDRIPIQMLQKLYRHTSITTTIGYQANFIHKDKDEALTAVIGF